MLNIHRSGIRRNVFTAVLAHCSSDITPPPCLPELTLSRTGKHGAVIPMGEKGSGKEKNNYRYFYGQRGCTDHMEDFSKGRGQLGQFYGRTLLRVHIDTYGCADNCGLPVSRWTFIGHNSHCCFEWVAQLLNETTQIMLSSKWIKIAKMDQINCILLHCKYNSITVIKSEIFQPGGYFPVLVHLS